VSVFAGAAVATLFRIFAGYLCLRLARLRICRSPPAFPLIALGLLFAFPDFSGGELGISGLRRLARTATGNYYVAAVSMLLIVFGLWRLADSKFGLVLHAIRDDEVAARASGINTPRYKLIRSRFRLLQRASRCAVRALPARRRPSTLEVACLPGGDLGNLRGVATIYGPVAAVFILYPSHRVARKLQGLGELRLLIFAGDRALVLFFMPRGLAPFGCATRSRRQCPRCKQRNIFYRKNLQSVWRRATGQVPGAQRLVGHQ